ncbi:hypothetical protein [Lacimonas salitolerans]|uniref:Uncharacterized protein n=1 Tax=Lacimonas salitolerans TaxID=1323750 RepID=A0ABW4EB10_9RHOB
MTLLIKARQNRLIALQKLQAQHTNLFADLSQRPAPVDFRSRRAA